MVKLTKIYTRGGDAGMTSLVDGTRLPKHHGRFHAVGAVDELNAAIGVARLDCSQEADAMLMRIQHDLFDLGADLATPVQPDDAKSLRILAVQVRRLEDEIDAMNRDLKPLDSFVLPGGSKASAQLHVARVIARRAERAMTELAVETPLNPEALRYINRLSDHCFVLSRVLNEKGAADVLWQPGVNR